MFFVTVDLKRFLCMVEDSDRLLDVVGVVLLVALIGALGLIVVVGMNPPSSQGPDQSPDTNWELQPINDTHVRITYAGSEPVPTENLTVTVSQYPRAVSWSGVLTSGDSGVLKARTGDVVRLYRKEGRDGRTLLERWDLGEDGS